MKLWTRRQRVPSSQPPARDFPWYPPPEDVRRVALAGRRGRGTLSVWLAVGALASAAFLGGYTYRALVAWPLTGAESPAERQARVTRAVLPEEGVTSGVAWGDILARLTASGVIDPVRFAAALQRSGHPLTPEQERILRGESDADIAIDRHNARFVLNALWAVGIANDTVVLREGPMSQLSPERRATLASTAGWTLGRRPGGELLGSLRLTELTPAQEAVLREVAAATYRPCCDNPTAFPDCNHGAAALGLATLMAGEGASAEDIFAALKGFNSFWYPDQFVVLARYFDQQGKWWPEVQGREALSSAYASRSGWTSVARQVQDTGGAAGGGCSA